MAPEGAADRRARLVPLLSGEGLAKGAYADLDQFQLGGILVYKTLVLRRSPAESRPPSAYSLVWQGRYYDVWQRPDAVPQIREHLPLGNDVQPGAVAPCGEVLRLGRVAGPGGRLAAVPRAPVVAVSLGSASYPPSWSVDGGGHLTPNGAGTIDLDVSVPRAGRYSLWLGGLFRDDLRVSVDGRTVADTSRHLSGLYVPLGTAFLTAGAHHVTMRYGSPGLAPGGGGQQFPLGPLLLSRDADDPPVLSVPSSEAGTLCGKTLDWIEALPS